MPTTAPNNTCNQKRQSLTNFLNSVQDSCHHVSDKFTCLVVHCHLSVGFSYCLPESTPCTQSNKKEIARSGSILAMYLITLSSLLYAYPHRLRMSTITRPPKAATNRDKSTTTQAARRAACGRPAPSSFETRVLYDITNHDGENYCKDEFIVSNYLYFPEKMVVWLCCWS